MVNNIANMGIRNAQLNDGRRGEHPVAWQDRQHVVAYSRFLAWFAVLFFPMYLCAGFVSAWSGRAFHLYLPFETQIPLIPWMIIPYFSLYTVFLVPLFLVPAQEMPGLTRQSVATLLIAFGAFLLVPGQLGFTREPVDGVFGPLFDVMARVDTPHNLVPSLHVAFAALILWGCAARAPWWVRWIFAGWLLLLAVSTVLVHQHHLVDVATGLTLAVAVRRLIPLSDAT